MNCAVSHFSMSAAKRENQDSSAVVQINGTILCLLADGMGGLKRPKQTSSDAIRIALQHIVQNNFNADSLVSAIIHANQYLLDNAPDGDVGTTLTIMSIREHKLYFSHIGDCRIYFFRASKGCILTSDHSQLAKQLSVKNPLRKVAKNNPGSKLLTRSLGEKPIISSDIEFSFEPIQLKKGDVIAMCSDGVWMEVDELKMKEFSDKEPHIGSELIVRSIRKRADDATCISLTVL